MMVGIVEVVGWLANAWRDRPARESPGWVAGSVDRRRRSALAVLLVLGFMFEVLPGAGRRVVPRRRPSRLRAGVRCARRRPARDAQGDGWSRYNFAGYEGRPPVPRVLRRRADDGGHRRRPTAAAGSTWENNEDNGQYGTTMALMLLPHWTDGCIASMEGLFFEASGTTPYHFLTTAAMSKQSSNPVRELRYDNNDAADRRALPAGARRALRDGPHRRGQGRGRGAAGARAARHERAVGDLPGRRLRHRRAARRPAGRRRPRAPATSASATSSSARAGSSTATSGRRCRPTTARRSGSASTVAVDESRPVPDPNRAADDPDTRGKQVDIVVPAEDDRAGRAARGRGQRRRDRPAGRLVPRRPGRRAGARQGQLLPELGRRRRRGPVPRRPPT